MDKPLRSFFARAIFPSPPVALGCADVLGITTCVSPSRGLRRTRRAAANAAHSATILQIHARVTEAFLNEREEAKKFAKTKLVDTLDVSAGTLNPHLPKGRSPQR